MRKILSIIGIMIGIMALIIGGAMKVIKPFTVSIIGGADGPTSVFLAGKVGSEVSGRLLIIGVVFLIFSVILLNARK